MGKMKELVMDIEDMLINGYDIEDVSIILGIPLKEVEEISKNLFGNEVKCEPDY